MTTTYAGVTPQEYLVRERAAKYKSEYVDGEIRAMAGASRNHNLLAVRLIVMLHGQLEGGPCDVFGSDMRVNVEALERYYYPDVTVVCGPTDYGPEEDNLREPVVVIEVLSPSSGTIDREEKRFAYRRVPTLRHYLVVSQSAERVEHDFRDDAGEWKQSVHSDRDDVIELAAIGSSLRLADLYRSIKVVP